MYLNDESDKYDKNDANDAFPRVGGLQHASTIRAIRLYL